MSQVDVDTGNPDGKDDVSLILWVSGFRWVATGFTVTLLHVIFFSVWAPAATDTEQESKSAVQDEFDVAIGKPSTRTSETASRTPGFEPASPRRR